ncbi:polysaccharide biosynthesis tyrosine autokinase [bacterium]|nr:polysaccharide biosynthesis tyrosine autokinase [bacterium]
MTRRDITNWNAGQIEPMNADACALDEPHQVDIQQCTSVLFRRWKTMLLTVILVFGLGMLHTCTRQPIYESSAKLVVVTTGSSSSTENDIPLINDLQALTRSRSVDTQVEIISSPDLLEEAFDRLNMSMKKYGFKSTAFPGWACNVAAKKDTDIISITARAYIPSAAAELANTIADTYFERDVRQNNLATHQAREYVERRMAIAENQLYQANARLSEFKAKTGLFAPEAQLTKTAEQIAQISQELDSTKADVASGRKGAQALGSQLAGQSQNVVGSTTIARNPHIDSVLGKIDSLSSERASLLQEFTPTSREIKSIDNRIRQEREKLKQMTESVTASKVQGRNPVRDALEPQYASNVASVAANSARANALGSILNKKLQMAQNLPDREREYNELVQRVTLLQRTYEMLSTKFHTLLLSEQSTLPNGMLVSRARIPGAPAYPDLRKNAIRYFLLGILLSVLVAIIADWLDSRVHEQTLVEEISDLPILSRIPNVSDPAQRMLSDRDHSAAMLESFRILRNNLSFSNIDRKNKILAVTSPGAGDGKTTTAINLAVAIAMEGKRVLLVEGDFRRPSLHDLFEVPTTLGFTAVLTGVSTLEQAIIKTSVENLSCLTSGPLPPHPTEILNSQQSRALFKKLAEMYDTIVIDCPPCVGLSDIQVISTIADGMLLVVSMNHTLRPHLYMTMRMLAQVKAPLIGLIINRIEMRRRGHGYYYYYGDYYGRSKNGSSANAALNSGASKDDS